MTLYDKSQADDADKQKQYRVGEFPIVHLNKPQRIVRNLTRSSSVRIAPPSKNVLNRESRVAIMRSNSFQHPLSVPKLVPVKMRANDDSHQIITNHEPLPPIEIAQSAKSVLDALEKNCRKRINNEELTLDRNKRVCAVPQEVVDAPISREFLPVQLQSSAKRGRDQVSPIKNSGDSPNSQQRKKSRLKNNALLSSLSSSQCVLKPFNIATSSPSRSASNESIATSTKSIDKEEAPRERQVLKEKSIPEVAPKPPQKRLYLFNRKLEPGSYRPRTITDDDDEIKINFVVPRTTPSATSVNVRHIEKDKLSIMLSGLSDGFKSPVKETPKDFVDAPAIPASLSFSTVTTACTVTPISTSALATNVVLSSSMVSPTAAILPLPKEQESKDKPEVPPTSVAAQETVEKPVPSFQFGASTSPSTSSLLKLPSDTSPTLVNLLPSLTKTSPPKFGAQTENALVDPKKPLISFTPVAKPLEAPALPSLNPITTSPSLPTFALSNSTGFNLGTSKDLPKLGSGISFGSNLTSSSTMSSNNLNATVTVTTSFLAPPNVSLAAVTTAPSFNFQQTPTTKAFNLFSKVSPATTTSTSLGMSSGIPSFSSNAGALASTESFIQKPETTTASGVGFSFNATSTAGALPQVTQSSTAPLGFSFGSSQNSLSGNVPAPASTTSSFNFGSSNSSFGQPAPVTTDSTGFGQQAPAPVPNKAFGFGQQSENTTAPSFSGFTQKTEAQPSTGMFSFGQTTSAAQAPTSTSTFSFGGSAQPATTQPSGFGFSQNNSNAQPPSFAAGVFGRLGDKPMDNKPSFNFGGNNQAPPSIFGNSNNPTPAPTAAPLPFGNSNQSAQPSPFGSSIGSSPFNQPSNNMFGGNQANSQINTSNIAAPKPTSGGMFSFGSSNNLQQQQQSQPTGAAFNFNSSAPANNTAPSNMFGGGPGQNVSASFTFNPSTGAVSNNANNSNVFGQSQNSSSAPPPAYQSNTTASASFTFGGSSANISQNSASSTGNAFNFGGVPQSAPVASGAFNFQAPQPSLTPQPTSGGLFTIGTGGNAQRRPIRQAMRRMK